MNHSEPKIDPKDTTLSISSIPVWKSLRRCSEVRTDVTVLANGKTVWFAEELP